MRIVLETCKTKSGKFRIDVTIHNQPGGFGASCGPQEFDSQEEAWAAAVSHAQIQKPGPWELCDANKN